MRGGLAFWPALLGSPAPLPSDAPSLAALDLSAYSRKKVGPRATEAGHGTLAGGYLLLRLPNREKLHSHSAKYIRTAPALAATTASRTPAVTAVPDTLAA